jgi:protein phosphatase
VDTISSGMTDVGLRRERNEDHFLINEVANLYAVADGMGGHVGGDTASQIALTSVEEVVQNAQVSGKLDADSASGRSLEMLKYGFRLATKRILRHSEEEPELEGMGTTLVAMILNRGQLHLAHVGDSRAYRVRDGKVHQITEDHTVVGALLKAGAITEQGAKDHPHKHIVTRSIGHLDDVEIDTLVQPVEEGDCYVLCTDGLSNLVDEDDIGEVVLNHAPRESCQKLVDLANARGGDDNITVVVARIDNIEA